MENYGEILGELKEFKRATLSELGDIKSDIKELKQFKWRMDGRNAFITVLIAAITSCIGIWISK